MEAPPHLHMCLSTKTRTTGKASLRSSLIGP
ncbi:hypothetical protein NC651_028742 [Populus alba x Populus x berolinensis]|nr:hypothetical protein NC651_028742 [Populus alba x Populus x berolinensis]